VVLRRGAGFKPTRPQDRSFVGNIVQAMDAYALGRLGPPSVSTKDADRLIAIGSDRMMAAVARARHDVLKDHLKPHHFAVGSINSPMQCMLKEICAQCLQPHRDPRTGKKTYVFSCFNQDQDLDSVDFGALSERLKQNSLQEKITSQLDPAVHAGAAQANGRSCSRLVPVLARRNGERHDRDAFLEQLERLVAGRDAADTPLACFLVVDAARFGRERLADILVLSRMASIISRRLRCGLARSTGGCAFSSTRRYRRGRSSQSAASRCRNRRTPDTRATRAPSAARNPRRRRTSPRIG